MLATFFFVLAAALPAQRFETTLEQKIITEYLLHVPESRGRKLPVIVYLHGGSARGDLARLRSMGLPHRVANEKEFPFIVLAPLLPEGEIWTNDAEVMALLDHVLKRYPADRDRVYLTGHSMGGRGALYIAYKHPQRFAAVVAMSAVSPIAQWATRLRELPLWYFHGVKDVQAPVAAGDELVAALRKADGTVKYTRMDERDHFILDIYDRDDLFAWLLEQRRRRK